VTACLLTAALAALLPALSPTQDAKAAAELQGIWVPASSELGGQAAPLPAGMKLAITGGEYTVAVEREVDRGTFKLDPKTNPKAMDITGTLGPNKGRTILAIYEVTADALKICYALEGPRPTEFKTHPGDKRFLVTYKRAK
jgi:uncharacterized protein (TIGR03067 family)